MGVDITLDNLFRAVKDIELPGGLKGQVQALSDAEKKERRRYALLCELDAAKELRDETSDAYRISVAPLAEVEDKDPLVSTILQVRRVELQQESQQLFPQLIIPIPDEADDVTEIAVIERRKETEAKTAEQRQNHIEVRMTQIREKLESQDIELLRKMARGLAVTVTSRRVMIDAICWYTVYAGVYVFRNGDRERLYQSPDIVQNSPESVIDRLYREVEEVNNVDPWEIVKNV